MVREPSIIKEMDIACGGIVFHLLRIPENVGLFLFHPAKETSNYLGNNTEMQNFSKQVVSLHLWLRHCVPNMINVKNVLEKHFLLSFFPLGPKSAQNTLGGDSRTKCPVWPGKNGYVTSSLLTPLKKKKKNSFGHSHSNWCHKRRRKMIECLNNAISTSDILGKGQ